jgi:hypothetical protein
MAYSPFMASVVLTTSTTVYSLRTLLKAIDANIPDRVAGVRLEMDIANAAGKIRIGGPLVSTTNCGWTLVPTGEANIAGINASPGGKLLTSDIYLVGDTNNQQVNVTLLPVGT